MEHRSSTKRHRAVWVALTACWLYLLPSGPLLAETDATEQTSPIERAAKQLKDVAGMVRNAEMRLGRNLVGASPEAGRGQAPAQTPAAACCRTNVETITKALQALDGLTREMRGHYAQQRNSSAMGVLDQMDMRLQQMLQGTIAFARAPTEARANSALQGLIRPVNEFRNGLNALRSCCPIGGSESPAEHDKDEQKDTKKTKKKKGS
jgi:hypothetical protein